MLRSAAAGRADQPVHFCYYVAGGGAQGFAAELGLDGGQAPALVAVAPKKQRSAVMTARFQTVGVGREVGRGLAGGRWHAAGGRHSRRARLTRASCSSPHTPITPVNQDSVKEWLDGLLSGKVRTAPLQQLPAWPAGGGAAGAAGEAAAEEDEFDLSDIMSVSGVLCWWTCLLLGGCGAQGGRARSRGATLTHLHTCPALPAAVGGD